MSKMTVLLAHGAWADGSSWRKVIDRLGEVGVRVAAVQMPLTSLADDAAAVRRWIDRATGPIVLVGHSYGGAAITVAAAGQDKVKALVYVAALAPAEGEKVEELLHREPPHPNTPALGPDDNGLIWMSEQGFTDAMGLESTPLERTQMFATQTPISVKCLGEAMGQPAWKEKPSWYLLAKNDRMISPATQLFMAKRMKAQIESVESDHTPLVSHPEIVTRVIMAAVGWSATSTLP